MIFLLVEHKRSNGPTLIGAGPGLSMNTDGGAANAELIGSARDGTEGRRHFVGVMREGDNQSG